MKIAKEIRKKVAKRVVKERRELENFIKGGKDAMTETILGKKEFTYPTINKIVVTMSDINVNRDAQRLVSAKLHLSDKEVIDMNFIDNTSPFTRRDLLLEHRKFLTEYIERLEVHQDQSYGVSISMLHSVLLLHNLIKEIDYELK